jgi:hypothetical protein
MKPALQRNQQSGGKGQCIQQPFHNLNFNGAWQRLAREEEA